MIQVNGCQCNICGEILIPVNDEDKHTCTCGKSSVQGVEFFALGNCQPVLVTLNATFAELEKDFELEEFNFTRLQSDSPYIVDMSLMVPINLTSEEKKEHFKKLYEASKENVDKLKDLVVREWTSRIFINERGVKKPEKSFFEMLQREHKDLFDKVNVSLDEIAEIGKDWVSQIVYKVPAIHCNVCDEIVFSRAPGDSWYCDCGDVEVENSELKAVIDANCDPVWVELYTTKELLERDMVNGYDIFINMEHKNNIIKCYYPREEIEETKEEKMEIKPKTDVRDIIKRLAKDDSRGHQHYIKWHLTEDLSLRYYFGFEDRPFLINQFVLKSHAKKEYQQLDIDNYAIIEGLISSATFKEPEEIIGRRGVKGYIKYVAPFELDGSELIQLKNKKGN